jgi:hypothetical protein
MDGGRIGWILIAAAALAPNAGAADARASLQALPVAGMKLVAPAEYRAASAAAARGGAPIEIALKIVGELEGRMQEIVQVNQGAEAPSAARVTILRDGLLDDSVRGDRWEVDFERSQAGAWRIKSVKRAWRCRRGGELDRFGTAPCP